MRELGGKPRIFSIRIWRRRIELNPTASGKIYLNPTMGVRLPDDVIIAYGVVLTHQETIHHACGNSRCAQKKGHRGCKILAMTGFRLEKECAHRLRAGFSR